MSISIYSAETEVAASENSTFSADYLHECELHQITFIGSGTANIEATFRTKDGDDASAITSIATGLTAGTDLYAFSGANSIKITETGGANAIKYIIKSYVREQ